VLLKISHALLYKIRQYGIKAKVAPGSPPGVRVQGAKPQPSTDKLKRKSCFLRG
jgi:hypothetical protein